LKKTTLYVWRDIADVLMQDKRNQACDADRQTRSTAAIS
jgi:hypothetical protein